MKKFIKLMVSVFILSFILSVGAECVVFDESLPYSGEYLYLYNSGADTASVTNLPVPSGVNENVQGTNSVPEGATGRIEVDGEILYTEEMVLPEIADEPVMLFSMRDDYKSFMGADSYKNENYMFFANKKFESDIVKVYVEENVISADEELSVATDLGNKFEDVLTYINENFASYEGKTTIIVHDIRDSFYYGKSSSFVAGYFSPQEYRTERIVHIDIFPLLKESESVLSAEKAYKTLVHEFTHLVEYSVNGSNRNVNDMWFSEIFALSSEEGMCKNNADYTRLFDLVRDYNGVIRSGAIVNYDEYSDNNSDVSANYGLLYAFGSYIKTRFGEDIFRYVLENSVLAESGEEALLSGIKSSSGEEITFDELLKDFYIALVLNEKSGIYKLLNSNYEYILNFPLGMNETLQLKPKASAIVPLFNEEFDESLLGEDIKYAVFSRDGTQQADEIKIGNDRKIITVRGNMLQIVNPVVNQRSLMVPQGINSELFGKIKFIPEDESKVFFGKNGVVLGIEDGTVKVRCQSLTNKEVYADFELITDDAPVCINHFSDAFYDDANNVLFTSVNIFNTEFGKINTLSIFLAVYDENLKFIGGTKKDVSFASAGTFYQRGIQFDGLDKNKKYTLKMFVFMPDGSLCPLSREYVTGYNM